MSREDAIRRLRSMRLVVQRRVIEAKHRVSTNGDMAVVRDLQRDEQALATAIAELAKEPT